MNKEKYIPLCMQLLSIQAELDHNFAQKMRNIPPNIEKQELIEEWKRENMSNLAGWRTIMLKMLEENPEELASLKELADLEESPGGLIQTVAANAIYHVISADKDNPSHKLFMELISTGAKPGAQTQSRMYHIRKISSLLINLNINPNDSDEEAANLYKYIMTNAHNEGAISNLIRAEHILECLKELNLDKNSMKEFFKGAHFTLNDTDREFFNMLVEDLKTKDKRPGSPPTAKRMSSHYMGESKSEYGIHSGKIIPELLVIYRDKTKETCFQAEASPWRGTKELIQNSMNMQHISDSVLYPDFDTKTL